MQVSVSSHQSHPLLPHLVALLTVTIWGTTFIATKLLLLDFSTVEIMALRFSIGFLTLGILRPRILHLERKRDELWYALAGLTGIALYFLLENTALTYTFASNVGIIIATAPFFTGLLSLIVYQDKTILRWQFFAGFLLSMAGIVLISQNGARLKMNPLGDVLTLGAALCWALYNLILKKIQGLGHDTLANNKRIFAWGLLFILPMLPFSPHKARFSALSPSHLILFLYLGVFACAICYCLWDYSVEELGPVKTSLYLYLNPLITLLASWLILGEPLTGQGTLGIFLILSGLLLSGH